MALETQQATSHAAKLTEIAIRGAATLVDVQMQTARDIMSMQSRTFSVFGVPDFSALFGTTDERARRVFSEGAEELINTTRRTAETVAEVNRQFGRLIEQQAVKVSETMCAGFDELGRHAEQGLERTRTMVERGLEEVASATRQQTQNVSVAASEAMRKK